MLLSFPLLGIVILLLVHRMSGLIFNMRMKALHELVHDICVCQFRGLLLGSLLFDDSLAIIPTLFIVNFLFYGFF
jgi:hypothetical protein